MDRRTQTTVPRKAGTSQRRQWAYDPSGNVVTELMPKGDEGTQNSWRTTTHTYDAANRPLETVVASGTPQAVHTRRDYDADSHVVATWPGRAYGPGGTGTRDDRYMTWTDYDTNGRPTQVWTPRYDTADSTATLTDASSTASGLTATQQRDECPTIHNVSNPVGSLPAWGATVGVCVTKTTYDNNSNPLTVELPTHTAANPGRTLTMAYTPDNHRLTVTGPNPAQSPATTTLAAYTYNGDGQVTSITDADSHATTSTYTLDHLLATQGEARGGTDLHRTTTYGYNANGQQISMEDPIGSEAQRVDPNHAQVTDRTTLTAYNPDGRTTSISAPGAGTGDRRVTSYAYDKNGNTKTVTDPNATVAGVTSTTNLFTWDNLPSSSTTRVDSSTNTVTAWTYDAGGRKTKSNTTTTGKTNDGDQTFTYFDTDKLATETGRGGSGAVAYQYDPSGDLAQVNDTTNNPPITVDINSRYLDGSPRTVTQTSGTAFMTSYAYDGAGHTTSRVDGTGTTTFTYNDAGLNATMNSNVLGAIGTTTRTYKMSGLRDVETAANGQKMNWTYSDAYDVNQLKLTKAGAQQTDPPKAQWDYTYDPLGRIVQQTFAGAAASQGTLDTANHGYAYDLGGRLTSDTPSTGPADTYTWDHNSNRLNSTIGGQSTNWTYNGDNTINTEQKPGETTPPYFSYVYDGSRRLTNDGCQTNTYDGLDRRTISTRPRVDTPNRCAAAPTAGSTVTWTYDGLDRQASATTVLDPLGTPPTTTTALRYDGLNSAVVREVATTTATASNTYLMDDTGTAKAGLSTKNGTTKTEYFAEDGHGNVTTKTDGAGEVSCTIRYNPSGDPRSAQPNQLCNTGSTDTTPAYRGSRRDNDRGTYQLGSRTYDPSKAGFLTQDNYRRESGQTNLSIGSDPLTSNRYAYVNGDALNLMDPSGHEACPDGDPDVCASNYGAADPATEKRASVVRQAERRGVKSDLQARFPGSRSFAQTRGGHVYYETRDATGLFLHAEQYDTSGGSGFERFVNQSNEYRSRYGSTRDKSYYEMLQHCPTEAASCVSAAYFAAGGQSVGEALGIRDGLLATSNGFAEVGEARPDLASQFVIDSMVTWGAGKLIDVGFELLARGAAEEAPAFLTLADEAGRNGSYSSFARLKSAYKEFVGDGTELHHLVGQCQCARSGFAVEDINSADNIVRLQGDVHSKITSIYNSYVPGTQMRTYEYLAGKSFDEQRDYAIDTLIRVLRGS